ncbi:MAG: hypothetical protein GXO84_08260 [Chlorobi bacterium]|nr:hypothetical protein [Chlorobiota bacterium]
MKKLNFFLTILIGLTIFTCSSNDSSNDNNDSIIGEWKLIGSLEFKNGELIELTEGECVQQSREIFSDDGIYSFIYYGFPQVDCIIEYQSTAGIWTSESNIYNIEYEVEYYDGSTQVQTIPQIRVEGDLMYYRYTEVIENGEVVEYYDRKFLRVQ